MKAISQNDRGQASIMIGMMMMTFIMFFAFVINTGMLVNAKINLQNAADLAAYAGASVQARQLNQISYLNYEMRRQYKKFLFRYYVMGNMGQVPFPRTGGAKTAPNWSPDGKTQYEVPVVCMIFNSKDNFCQLPFLPHIVIPSSNPLDAINETLIGQLKQIETIRQQNCVNIGVTNTMVLRLWLWNSDPGLENLGAQLPPVLQKSVNTIRGLAFGIGLIPREVILRRRIETLKDYVNEAPLKSITFSKVQGIQKSQDPAAQERTIEAFLSAYYTLGNHTFAGSDVTMDELTPGRLLELKDIKTKFDAYAINFELRGGVSVGTADSGSSPDCLPVVEADTIHNKFPIGVYKDTSIMTYYAVKLKAKAKIMFSPFPDMELKAYAAAQPFGSRIGPKYETDKTWVRKASFGNGLPLPAQATGFQLEKKIPNLPLREQEDSAAAGSGWDTQEALGAFYSKFAEPSSQGVLPPSIGQDELNRAYQAAMVPNPYEGFQYNIINDLGNDPMVHNFDSTGTASFWAPIFPPSKAANAEGEIQSIVDDLMGDTGQNAGDFRAAIKKELTTYFGKLHQGQGEPIGGAAESFNIARLQDPIMATGSLGQPQPITLDGGLALTDQAKLKTSWNGVLNGEYRKQGRVGYSVKFVSFSSLLSQSSKTNGQDTWTNPLDPDSEAGLDLPLIRH